VLASRQLITDAGSFDETMRSAEDYDLWTRLALRSAVAILDEALVQVRVHQGNLSNDWSSAFAGRDHFLLKLQGLVHGPRLALLKRERARNAARLATLHAVGGNHRTALQALWNSVPYAWPYLDWWKGVARSVVRPHLPARLMDIYRGYRNGP
jgi:hypothetical protein